MSVRNVFIMIVLIAALGFIAYKFSIDDAAKRMLPSASSTIIKSVPDKIVLPPPPKKPVLRAGLDSSAQIVADTKNSQPSLWVIVDDAKLSLPLSNRVTEKRVMRIDQVFLGSLQSGSEMQLTLPDGRRMVAVVDQWIVNPDGDKTLQAHIETNFGDYPFTYTMGKNEVGDAYGFGFIGLPEGRFTIEASGQYGVVYRNPELPRSTDPTKKDYVLPERQSVTNSSAPTPSTIKP